MIWSKGTKNPQQLVAQWLGFLGFTAVAWVQFLVRELRSHKPHGTAKKRKTSLLPSTLFEVPVTHSLLVSFFYFWPWSKVWGILDPDQQWNPYLLHCKQEVLITGPPGKLPHSLLGTITFIKNPICNKLLTLFVGSLNVASSAAAAAKSLQSCPTLCGPTDGSPPCSPIHGILQARTLEWVAISFSNA